MCLSWFRKREATGQLKNAFMGLQLQGFVMCNGFIKASEVHAVVPGIADVSCLYCSASSHSRKVNVCCEEDKLGNSDFVSLEVQFMAEDCVFHFAE